MDPSNSYYGNGLNNNHSSLPGVSPQQLQHSTTLPPLQPQHPAMQQNNYGSNPHTPRTPGTPNTPGSASMMANFPQGQMQQQQQQPRYMISQNTYPPQQVYRTSGPMIPQSSTAMSQPQAIAPAPIGGRMLQNIRPANGMNMQPSMQSPYGQNSMLSQPPMMLEEQPTHVVGSQGRRGILPSAPGRPAVSANASAKGAVIPQKDADGKFPCPHCTKTYLHAKHLKRHLLRHTGDRPYMCVLCRDTFSRSDILKRHFQKCSIRRGNPTGASHLSHAQAHLKKSHPGPHHTPKGSMSNDNQLMGVNGMANLSDSALHPFGVIADGSVPDAGSNLTDEQAAQVGNMNRRSRDDGSMANLGPGGPNQAFNQGYGGMGNGMPPSAGMNPSIAFSMPNGQNGHSYSAQGYDYAAGNQSVAGLSNLPSARNSLSLYAANSARQQPGAWSQLFQPTSQNGFATQYNNFSNAQAPVKIEPSLNNPTNIPYNGGYLNTPQDSPVKTDYPKWNIPTDYYQEISNRLIFFCFPQNNQITNRSNEMRAFLSADNIKHFLAEFSNFQTHFPIIHMPTFRIAEAYDGLLLAMICVGAVYSDRMEASQVRDMMEFARGVIERSSEVFAAVLSESSNGSNGYENGTFASSNSEIEHIQSFVLMGVLFTWSGTPIMRERSRQQFVLLVALCRKAGLALPKATPPFSALHQPHLDAENFHAASFDWSIWVEQEKRSRLMYMVFLMDAANVIYFNQIPQFEFLEIKVPLPADDAAWEAVSSTECAECLGLHGPALARNRNPSGSRRTKQPEMDRALKALMHSVFDLQPGTTNIYSKFILVHALHIQLWHAQRQQSQEAGQLQHGLGLPPSAGSTPLAQHDWIRSADPAGSGVPSANTSGRATPVEGGQSPAAQQQFKMTSHAFEKWKKSWDEDMFAQYPPSTTPSRRFGFCRDGSHFYWLFKLLSKGTLDWQMAPDQRFGQIIGMLKQVKAYVVSDSSRRGEDLGSVNDIDKDFGVKDLTLDMRQVFRPIESQTNSPVGSVQMKFENGNGMR